MGRPYLELKQISKSFQNNGGEVNVLSDISLHVEEGEFVSVIGPSGSGKSTLFHIIGGLQLPTSGNVLLEGTDVTGHKGLISYMPQHHSLFPWRTIEHNVILALEVAGVPKKQAREQAKLWLSKVGLSGYEKEYPSVLSGGMQQRVSFLRALLSPRQLMCLDEPFGALDALTRLDMQRWLLSIWEQNKRSVLFVTHSIEEALLLSDRIYVFSDKPTKVLHQIEVPFDRPRDEEIMHDPRFVSLRKQIYDRMKEEQHKNRMKSAEAAK